MYLITKEFKFDAGHRVYNQMLDEKLAFSSLPKCRFLHGHTYKVKVNLKSDNLVNDMVLDFNNLTIFKKYLDTVFDHGFMIYKDDLLFKLLIINMPESDEEAYRVSSKDLDENLSYVKKEFLESFIICKFNPTAENLSRHFYNWLEQNLITKIKEVKLHSVVVYETETSFSEFIGG